MATTKTVEDIRERWSQWMVQPKTGWSAQAIEDMNTMLSHADALHATADTLRAANGKLREALELLAVRRMTDGSLCWCLAWDSTKHKPVCARVRAVIAEEVEGG